MLQAVALISPQNRPILVHSFVQDDDLKYNYIAHTSLDVIEERLSSGSKSTECYLGHLFSMEDVAVYGYVTPTRIKLVVALALMDSVIRDADIIAIFKSLHSAYVRALSNPFLRLNTSPDVTPDPSLLLTAGGTRWKTLLQRVDDIGRAVGNTARTEE